MDNLKYFLCDLYSLNGRYFVICSDDMRKTQHGSLCHLASSLHIKLHVTITFIWYEICYNQVNPFLLFILTLYRP